LSVRSPQLLYNQLIDFYEIQQGDHTIESVLDSILFNPIGDLQSFQNADIQTSEVDENFASVSEGP
jgi:hypothetical protein